MQSTLEALRAAHSELKARLTAQEKLSQAQAKALAEVRRLEGLKAAAAKAGEDAAQVGARRLLAEASDKEVREVLAIAAVAHEQARGADEAIALRTREAELIHGRYMQEVPLIAKAQEQYREKLANVLMDAANRSANEYLAEVEAHLPRPLAAVLGCMKALERIGKAPAGFASHYPLGVDLPAFPGLDAFKTLHQRKFTVKIADPQSIDALADEVVRDIEAAL